MNFNLSQLPERQQKPRQSGYTMVMDKGLSIREVEDFASNGGVHADFVKLGFGTSFVTPQLDKKIQMYQQYQIPVFFGGTLFEAFLIRNEFDNYIKTLKDFGITHAEVSDGSIEIPHEQKCEYIARLKEEGFFVLSEVGSKDVAKVMAPFRWIQQMSAELEAGSSVVIAEAREAGNIGIYRGSGEVREGLIEEILMKIPQEKIIWEAPQKSQQLFFIELLGCNASLGNIAPQEIIALEAMRLGLRGDTFHLFLDK